MSLKNILLISFNDILISICGFVKFCLSVPEMFRWKCNRKYLFQPAGKKVMENASITEKIIKNQKSFHAFDSFAQGVLPS